MEVVCSRFRVYLTQDLVERRWFPS
jgi:hypothetical protein